MKNLNAKFHIIFLQPKKKKLNNRLHQQNIVCVGENSLTDAVVI